MTSSGNPPAAGPSETAGAGLADASVRLVATLALCHFLAMVDRNLLALLATPIKLDLGLSDTELGLVHGPGFALLYALAIVPAGLLADRIDRLTLLMAGLLAWSLGILGYALAGSFAALFAAALLVGLGQAVLLPSALSILAGLPHPERRGRRTAAFTSGAILGRASVLMGGGLLLTALSRGVPAPGAIEPWRAVILLSLPLNALALGLLLRSRRAAKSVARAPAGGRLAEPAIWLARHLALFGPLFLLMCSTVLTTQSLAAWTPTLLHRRFGFEPGTAGLLVGAVTVLAGVCGHWTGGRALDAGAERDGAAAPFRVGALALAGAGPCLVALAQGISTASALAGLAGFAFAMGAATPAGLTALQALTPPEIRGGVSGLMLMGTALCGVGLGPLLVGYGSERMGSTGEGLGRAVLMVILPALVTGVVAGFVGARRVMLPRGGLQPTRR